MFGDTLQFHQGPQFYRNFRNLNTFILDQHISSLDVKVSNKRNKHIHVSTRYDRVEFLILFNVFYVFNQFNVLIIIKRYFINYERHV